MNDFIRSPLGMVLVKAGDTYFPLDSIKVIELIDTSFSSGVKDFVYKVTAADRVVKLTKEELQSLVDEVNGTINNIRPPKRST